MDIKTIKQLGILFIFASLPAMAFATAKGFYVGLDGGLSNTHNESKTIQTGGVPGTIKVDPSTTGFGGGFFLGYNISPFFAVEGGFTHYANATYTTNIPQKCNSPQIHENSVDFVGKAMLPFGDAFDVFAKGGVAAIRQSLAGSLLPTSTNLCGGTDSTTTATRPTAAIGASYYINQNWVADISWSRVFEGSGIQNADLLALGISYHFVDKYCGQFLC